MEQRVFLRCAVSNTGPMISFFQSERAKLLQIMYDRIYVPESALAEYTQHGSRVMIEKLTKIRFIVACELNAAEKQTAKKISEQIANHRLAKSRNPHDHYPEAEAIVLMERTGLQALEIILDEQAPREIAKKRGIFVVGFAGILVRSCKEGYITAEEVRGTLLQCQSQGTHYAADFIDGIYLKLKEMRDEK